MHVDVHSSVLFFIQQTFEINMFLSFYVGSTEYTCLIMSYNIYWIIHTKNWYLHFGWGALEKSTKFVQACTGFQYVYKTKQNAKKPKLTNSIWIHNKGTLTLKCKECWKLSLIYNIIMISSQAWLLICGLNTWQMFPLPSTYSLPRK